MWILRALMLLALIVWIGGIIFFAMVLAPTLFAVLPTPQMAGEVVAPTLTKLHNIGLVAGVVFLVSSIFYNRIRQDRLKLFSATHLVLVAMLALTAISQFVVTPRMRMLRASSAGLQSFAARDEFERLHQRSTMLEGGTLFLGLAAVALTARRFGNPAH